MKHLSTLTALAVSLLALPAMADAPKRYLTVPGTDTAIQVYGRVTFDMTHDFVQNTGVLEGLSAASTVSDENRPKNQWDMTIACSRFGLRTVTPSEFGDIKTRFEMDFNGTNKDSVGTPHKGENSNYAHVRQMYGTIGHWTIGKTDSNFMDPDGSPNYIDEDGLLADDYGVGRIPMIKYTQALTDKMELNVSIEKNAYVNGVGGKIGVNDGTPRNDWPGSFVARMGYADKWGHVSFSGAASRMSAQWSGTDAADNVNKSKTTFSWTLSGHFQFGEDSLVWQFGEGSGQYGSSLQDGVFLINGDVKEIKSRQALLGFEHFWTPKVHSNIFGSLVSFERNADKGMTADAFHTYTQIGANTIYNPTRTVQLAVEYIWGQAKTFDANTITKSGGGTTDAVHESKLHFQAKFQFN
jgi:hypothetical protein